MNTRRNVGIILALSAVVLFAGVGCAERRVQAQGAESAAPEGTKITVQGKIDYMKNLGGYFIMGEVPAREYIIMNENPQILERLFKSGKPITIEGRIVRGAEYLFIEKIDGQPYAAK